MLFGVITNIEAVNSAVQMFARGGGGGSDSGDGGGELFIAVGYGVGYAVAKLCKKILPFKLALIVSSVVLSIATITLLGLSIAGASFLFGYINILVIIGIWTGWYTTLFDVWQKMKGKMKKADADIAKARQTDAIWDEQQMHELAKNVFVTYQHDWTTLDTSRLLQYATQKYASKASILMRILRDMHRQNAVMNPEIIKIDTIEIQDNIDNALDTFTVMIEAKAQDMLIDLKNNTTIFTDTNTFIELWTFARNGDTWLLDEISQYTANKNMYRQEIAEFAQENGMVYSIDMGWLFLPQRGQIFVTGAMGAADINNHATGYINGILTQLYTYNSGKKDDETNYVIAQITVPKYYGNILVKPKRAFFSTGVTNDVGAPNNATKYEFEWADFNKKYEVWATDADRLASFELINPKFMQSLYDVDEKIVLEVVDNCIYFRTKLNSSKDTYAMLMGLLKQAYKELKL